MIPTHVANQEVGTTGQGTATRRASADDSELGVRPVRTSGEYPTTSPRDRAVVRRTATELAQPQSGVLSRDLLMTCGADDRVIRRELAAGRWRRHGRQTIALHTGDLDVVAQRWRAIWESGVRIAAIDGVTALKAAGLTGFTEETIHVSVRHSMTIRPTPGVVVHKLIRRLPDELLDNGLPRTRPAIAAVRAAQWARSDRQAALVLAMTVQQRLATGDQLLDASIRVRRRNRRRLIHLLAADIADGAHSLGELDVVAACRARGLPEPSRQAVRRLPTGTAYLDLEWHGAKLAVEVDGSGHFWGLQPSDDALRFNEILLQDTLVLRVNLLGWRLDPQAYVDQICRAYFARTGSTAGSRYFATF